MDREQYNQCIADALKGKKFTPEERRTEFCVASKMCSGKTGNVEEARQICLATPPKEPRTRPRARRQQKGGLRLVLLTTSLCAACKQAEEYLSPSIKKGDVEVKNIQEDNEAADLAAKHGITAVPKLLLLDSSGDPFAEIPIADEE